MPIEPLPKATVRAIGSTSVISDPCSVVKELIDNALDASATSLQVEISQNTVDVVQLKDNGHGIAPEDYTCVCKHTFTSKIQTIEDLKNIGGTSFGFRGEALASIAEMSGGITITTRVASDITGSCLSYGRDGELMKAQRASHPVGTTLRITDFLKNIPVRRQTALKGAPKTLIKIKKLLQTYAIAQPSKRFSLRVLKANNENSNWVYAPGVVASIPDAVTKTFGRDVSSCCVVKKMPSEALEDEESTHDQGYRILAFLPRLDSELFKVNGTGQFFSVDGRPLSTSRGVGQEIVKLFKSYIRAAAARNGVTKAITDPFLCVQLSCPQGAYDANIEPGKDDLLLEDREHVIALVGSLFCDLYGQLPELEKKSPKKTQAVSMNESDRFDTLLASRRDQQPDIQPAEATSKLTQRPTKTVSTLELMTEALDTPEAQVSRDEEPQVGSRTSQTSTQAASSQGPRCINPWSITRLNASFHTPRRASHATISERTPDNSSPEQERDRAIQQSSQLAEPESPNFPSPASSRLASTSPQAQRTHPPASQEAAARESHLLNNPKKVSRERDRERYGNGALDTWFQRLTQTSIQQGFSGPSSELDEVAPPLSQLAQERFGSPKRPIPEHAVADASPSGEQPNDYVENTSSEGNAYQGSMDSGRGFPVLERWAANLHEGFNPESQSELDKALDFEKRKKEAMRIHRLNSRGANSSQKSSASSHTPHHNRFLKAKAALSAEDPFATVTTSRELVSQDPRAYLLNQQSDQSGTDLPEGGKSRRSHTRRLPFERVPDGWNIHDLGTSIHGEMHRVKKQMALLASYDSYMSSGHDESPFTPRNLNSLVPFWNERVNKLLGGFKDGNQSEPQAPRSPVELSESLNNHMKQFSSTHSNGDAQH
ncbi:DNA mismatch repair protein C-terminal [Penicillium chermesinum]|uniref:DNA mismatch repair protein C-terminal n=1 Tax=Penicillium chermesinum TaxID=63820 RepID=A0A9W9TNB6_9EURO|nr:DNA mismatch repair protein C-terminal [Penicillium chermesinum]KAJ5232855.1 DNA mismatch repair protein C-terminal [Penicillium chermesinum]KAJ6172505.1 DNA mismatch repair protein C-terminal [Penicillium chermesinum]